MLFTTNLRLQYSMDIERYKSYGFVLSFIDFSWNLFLFYFYYYQLRRDAKELMPVTDRSVI